MRDKDKYRLNIQENVKYETFKLVRDLMRIVDSENKLCIDKISRFLRELNTAMFDFVYPNFLNPLFTRRPTMYRLVMALYVMSLRTEYFSCLLESIDYEIEYNYKYNTILAMPGSVSSNGGISTSTIAMFDSGKLYLGRIQKSVKSLYRFLVNIDSSRGKYSFPKRSKFDLFTSKVIKDFFEARRDKLGNPRYGSSMEVLLLFYFKSRTFLYSDLISAVRYSFVSGKLSFLKKLTIPMMLTVAKEEIDRNPMFYLKFFKEDAREDESHNGEPGDWYLAPHPTIYIRNKILEQFSDIEEDDEIHSDINED